MKKLSIFLFIILLCCATALGETFTSPGAFTLEMPQGWAEDISYNQEYSDPENGYFFLGYLEGDDMLIDMEIEDWRDAYENLSLYSASPQEIEEYKQDILDMVGEDGAHVEFLEIVSDNPLAVPFLLFYVNDEEYGEYYYVDTCSGGWCIMMYAYSYYEDDALCSAHLEKLKDILSSFQPIL